MTNIFLINNCISQILSVRPFKISLKPQKNSNLIEILPTCEKAGVFQTLLTFSSMLTLICLSLNPGISASQKGPATHTVLFWY